MKTLLAVLLGIVLGMGAMYMTMKPYMTSSESDVRLYAIVWGWTDKV